MNFFHPEDVEKAIKGVCDKLGLSIDTTLQKEYQNGQHPTLLSYEKVDEAEVKIPAIQKYLIGAQTYLNQPTNYFDIYRTTRHIIFIQLLNNAVKTVIEKVNNYEEKIRRLCEVIDYDPFEAIFYEVLIASNYSLCDEIEKVIFLDESDLQTPDIEAITSKKKELYIECKKFDRSVDIVSEIRKNVNKKVQLMIKEFLKIKQSAIVEISFNKDPEIIDEKMIREACLESLKKRTVIINKDFSVNIKPIDYKKLEEFALYPSPKLFWERYEYMENSEWFGIITPMNANYAHHIEVANAKKSLASTWLNDIEWECAVKWKITDEDIIRKQKRLGYSRIFKGLNQLQTKGDNSVLHVWFERDHSLGHRQGELMQFFNTLKTNARDFFSWMIFNETILEVSPKGRFDLIEHAHVVQGPMAESKNPLITTIFTKGEGIDEGAFGIGQELPHIDEVN